MKEAMKSISWINTWFDFRVFSKQRHLLLEDPGFALTPPPKTESPWKSSLGFATQGLVLTTIVIQVLASAFGLVLSRPKPYTERIRTNVQENLVSLNETAQTLKLNLAVVETADEDTLFEPTLDILKRPVRTTLFGVPKADYVKALNDAIGRVNRSVGNVQSQSDQVAKQLDLAKRADQLPSKLFRILLPLTLVLSAYIFRFLFGRMKEARGIENKDHSDVAYLYLTTSHLFWMNAGLSIATAVLHNTFIYSGLYDRQMSESLGSLGTTQLLFMGAEIIIPVLLFLPLIIFSFRKTSQAIRTIFDLPASTSGLISSYIRVSNFISFLLLSIVLVLVSLGCAKVTAKWEGLALASPTAVDLCAKEAPHHERTHIFKT